jgi:uncharacterized SAM-binding protein YcdF (DUF218 family)
MFFLLSKLLFYLIMPITWLLVFLTYAFLTKNIKHSRIALGLALGTLLLFTNSYLLNEVWLWWEVPPVPLKEVKKHDAAILLTGFTSLEKSPHDRVYTNKGTDRLLHTVMLYKRGYVNRIIVSGGSGLLRQAQATEAAGVRSLLLLAGIPDSAILMESKSRNTRENALYTKELVGRQPELQTFILVTSAFHMRRSTACFTKAGMAHTVFPTDYYSGDRIFRLEDFIPSEHALAGWQRVFHEIAGYLIYKAMGYS